MGCSIYISAGTIHGSKKIGDHKIFQIEKKQNLKVLAYFTLLVLLVSCNATEDVTAWNLTDLKLNYHTQHNRRIQSLDLTKIDFSDMGDQIVHIALDKIKEQDVEELLPEI